MASVKNLVFTNKGIATHSAYTVREDILLKAYLNENIGAKAFKNDSTIECVLFSANAKIIADSAFENCKNLRIAEYEEVKSDLKEGETAADLPILGNEINGKTHLSSPVNNITVQHHAFRDCDSLHTVVFPKLCKVIIEKEAFLGCTELRTVVVWDGNADIDTDAFIGCDSNKLVFVTNCEDTNCNVIKFAREHGFRYVIADNCK